MEWFKLQSILIDEAKLTLRELEYLENAFVTCERLWSQQVARVTQPKLVVIGEAPLFGDKKSYVYSPATPQSSFLYASDFPEGKITGSHGPLQNKQILLDRMAMHGVVIVDAFPYALNPVSTPSLHFRNMSPDLYARLLERVFHDFTAVKLREVGSTKFAVRYARTYDSISKVLASEGFESPLVIGKQGGGVDRVKFHSLLQSTQK